MRLTLLLSLGALLIGTLLGFSLALCRLARPAPARWVAELLVECLCGTPLLLQFHLLLALLLAPDRSRSLLLWATLVLGIHSSAWMSEAFRSAIRSVDAGRVQAARALGMDAAGAFRWVLLPHVTRRVLPALLGEAGALLKDSSLVSILAAAELTGAGVGQARLLQEPAVLGLAVTLYLSLTIPLSLLARMLDDRWEVAERHRPGHRRRRGRE